MLWLCTQDMVARAEMLMSQCTTHQYELLGAAACALVAACPSSPPALTDAEAKLNEAGRQV